MWRVAAAPRAIVVGTLAQLLLLPLMTWAVISLLGLSPNTVRQLAGTMLATSGEAERLLDEVGITVNKNAIPFDPLPPNTASGIRVGTPATTSRGFGPEEMRRTGELIVRTLREREDEAALEEVARNVKEICARFPVPGLPDA